MDQVLLKLMMKFMVVVTTPLSMLLHNQSFGHCYLFVSTGAFSYAPAEIWEKLRVYYIILAPFDTQLFWLSVHTGVYCNSLYVTQFTTANSIINCQYWNVIHVLRS